MKKTALITGITGQDGAYLALRLLDLGYRVHGMRRRTSSDNTARLRIAVGSGFDDITLHSGDLCDGGSLNRVLAKVRPDEIYNLGAMSHVKESFAAPEQTAEVDGLGTLRLLEAIRSLGMERSVRFYQASTSELFGGGGGGVQSETTPFNPKSPYGAAKLFAYWTTVNYREAYGIFACNGILFNHESPLRGEDFVTRKITRGVAEICAGRLECLKLGNLDAGRDWGHARDFVEAMRLMLQAKEPGDFVIATGRMARVRDFARMSFARVGINVTFDGIGNKEAGFVESVDLEAFNAATGGGFREGPSDIPGALPPGGIVPGARVVVIDPANLRPTDAGDMRGNPSLALERLGWRASTSLEELVAEMVDYDLAEAGLTKPAAPFLTAPGVCRAHRNGPIEGTS